WSAYLPPDKQQDETLPSPLAGQIETNVQAMSDGFLSVEVSSGSNVDVGETYACTDAKTNPNTRVSGAAVANFADSTYAAWSYVKQACLFTPVRRSDYYNVHCYPRIGKLINKITFQPFPLGFGDWEQLSFNQLYQGRDKDGFVVATIDADWAENSLGGS